MRIFAIQTLKLVQTDFLNGPEGFASVLSGLNVPADVQTGALFTDGETGAEVSGRRPGICEDGVAPFLPGFERDVYIESGVFIIKKTIMDRDREYP